MPRKIPQSLDLSEIVGRIPVSLEDQEGKKRPYELVEMLGPDLDKWRTYARTRTREEKGRFVVTIDTEYCANLIFMCLKPLEGSPEKTVDQIKVFASNALGKLYQASLVLNGMVDEEDEEGERKN